MCNRPYFVRQREKSPLSHETAGFILHAKIIAPSVDFSERAAHLRALSQRNHRGIFCVPFLFVW